MNDNPPFFQVYKPCNFLSIKKTLLFGLTSLLAPDTPFPVPSRSENTRLLVHRERQRSEPFHEIRRCAPPPPL